MIHYGFFELLLARPPSRLARFPELPLEQALLELQAVQAALAQPPAPAVEPTVSDEAMDSSLATLATSVWRAKGRMVDPATGEPHEESRRTYRHLAAAGEALEQMGVRMADWLQQPFDSGLPLKVLSFQPTAGLAADTVVEVVRPAVFWRDRLLQAGEVVVGIPETVQPSAT